MGNNKNRLDNDFDYHAPKAGQPEKYEKIRTTLKMAAHIIDNLCPDSREKSLAFTQLEQAMFYANAAIARHGKAEFVKPEEVKPSRGMVVEWAKNDIEDLKDDEYDGYYKLGILATTAHFIVDSEKRTVVALLRGYVSGEVRGRGIAKCAPDDVFNEHIGKAIALRRALGIKVPRFLYTAPKPEGVRVGDVIRDFPSQEGTVTAVKPKRSPSGLPYHVADEGLTYIRKGRGGLAWTFINDVRVIDDTNRVNE